MRKLFLNKKNKTKKGFTLIEMMISIFIFAIMMTSIVGIFARQISSYKQTRIMANDLENAQFALNYIAKTLRTASILGQGSSTGSGGTVFLDYATAPNEWTNDFWATPVDKEKGLIVYDFSQEACIIFTFRDSTYTPTGGDTYGHPALWMESQTGTVGINDIEKCLLAEKWDNNNACSLNSSNCEYKEQRLTTGEVTGNFYVAPTRYRDFKDSRGTDVMGRATVAMSVVPSEYANVDHVDPVYIQSTVALRDYPSDLSF
jgi:prepilin-type N-terminal cleavage/methylation domain-containing protein